MKKKLAVLIMVLVIAMSTANTFAFDINIDGVKQTPVDVNGKELGVFNLNGTVYVPVRFVSEQLGYTVDWDQETQTVKLSSPKLGVVESAGGDVARVFIDGSLKVLDNSVLSALSGTIVQLKTKQANVENCISGFYQLQTEKETLFLKADYCNGISGAGITAKVYYSGNKAVGADIR